MGTVMVVVVDFDAHTQTKKVKRKKNLIRTHAHTSCGLEQNYKIYEVRDVKQ